MISQREESEEDSYRRVTRRNQRESEEELHKESEGGVRGEELHKEFLVSDPSWCDSRRLCSSCLHLFCSSAPGSEVKHIQVAAERIHTLLSLPRKTFIATIRSNFLCDENSIPISQDFTLLDLQFLPEPR